MIPSSYRTKTVKTFGNFIDFSTVNNEIFQTVETSADYFDTLLSFYCHPSVHPLVSDQIFIGVEDIRFYVNKVDLSKQVKAELTLLLKQADGEKLRNQYREGVNQYLKYIKPFTSIINLDIDRERAILDSILKKDVTSWMEKLGDRKMGWSGNLHVINYIYKTIDLPPLSLNSILTRYSADKSKAISLQQLDSITYTFSEGPASFTGTVNAGPIVLRGRLNFSLEVYFENPVYEELLIIKRSIEAISKNLEGQRVDYLNPIKDDLVSLENDTKLRLKATDESVKMMFESVKKILK